MAQDELLGPAFNEVAAVDWSTHLPKLTGFWCRVLFDMPGYQGNPYQKHAEVHERRPFTEAQFRRWLALFNENVDLRWVGPNADRVKTLAANVARVHSKQLIDVEVELSAHPR